MNTKNWMKDLNDGKLLRQIVMPGSHDAGVYGTTQTILRTTAVVKKQYVVCQHSDFGMQALAGSRFFDCRVFFQKIATDQRVAPDQKYRNVLGHFAKEKVAIGKLKLSEEAAIGGYGGALGAVLGQALEFVVANPTEFVILRFSHTYHPSECVREVKQIIASKPTYQNAVYKQSGNLAMKRIGELRGKVIMVFDEKFNHHITPTEGILRFSKYKEGLQNIDGLSTCGEFKGGSIKTAVVHATVMGEVEKHLRNHPGEIAGHLHFVYWQQTAGVFGEKDVFKTTSAPKQAGQQWSGGAHANLGDLMTELKARRDSAGRLPVNIVSHDFVTAETCEKIVRLNPGYP